nr:ribosomal protein L32 [Opuntia macbridei]YP_010966620.1 ribosomal protein L32 [Opuntia macbridei]YP_010967247.1 ribosomal protein L32 [Opuntia quitensis]YP_010967262.1 ribosomal protein L32 [Opuntia quitensis]YP_010968047.1 ribosomal protein L32 [Airampoa erectoclada]YP_010968062.1 ribosomal protein L32 [Airampoa erectoclada]YP_010968130.1 ribosomal protein L32 [Airampoa soehrensii]YP_010968143.1 ribosomal protein L32 [Airampoa soehrensii]WNM92835.1 ribosomal protein L32 [Opuntia macbrid
MAVPKKRTSISKKHIRKNFWKKKGYWAALKAFSIAKSLYSGNSTLFIEKKNKKNLRRIRTIEIRTIEVGLTQKNLITN